MIRLFNTLTRRLEELKPTDGEVKLYTCGPTVYDFAHIGNLRSFVFDDTLRRMLQINGLRVCHVMNITDVGHLSSDADEGEDKLEKGAERENKSVWDVAQLYIDAFVKDMKQLNVLEPNGNDGKYARATDFIDEQIELVRLLLDKDFAYHTDNAIYFDVTKLDDYGKLTGQKLSDKETGARDEVVIDMDKRHPQDFALWFFKTGRFANHSMSWNSPWGEGFPGWHLECSAIIHATLGEPIDIHTGGVDHIGTHHTNELAQTEAGYGKELSSFWIHNEHLLVDGSKMSKSKNNYFTLADVIRRGYDPLALRLLFLQSHYRSQSNFSWEGLDAAQARLTRLKNAVARAIYQTGIGECKISLEDITSANKEIKASLANDLNTPEALASLDKLLQAVDEQGLPETLKEEFIIFIKLADDAFGLKLQETDDISSEQKALLKEREVARNNNNWSESDQLRQKLIKLKIDVSDTPHGQVWRRI